MQKPHFTQEQLVQVAKLTDTDIEQINLCRGEQSKIGYAYQICYVKLFNRLPPQSPLEIIDELATFVAIQIDIPKEQLSDYALRQPTISEHQEHIRAYLRLNTCTQKGQTEIEIPERLKRYDAWTDSAEYRERLSRAQAARRQKGEEHYARLCSEPVKPQT